MSGRYITWADVVGKYGEVQKDKDAKQADNYFIVGAEAQVDASLAAKYTVPFSPAPAMVRDLCIDLTFIKMNIRSKNMKPLIDDFNARIKGLQDGSLILADSGTNFGTPNAAWISNSYRSAFGHDRDINWRPSTDEILNEQSVRRDD